VSSSQAAAPPRSWSGLRALLAALSFLTRVPVPRRVPLDGDDVARAGPAFPVIGAGIGAAVGAIAAALAPTLTPLLATAIALGAGALLTGALHLDALADTADALGADSRDRALQIMREPTVGAFGVVAVAIDLLVRAAALNALVGHHRVVRLALAAGALSRVVPVLMAAALGYARSGGGTGMALTRGSRLLAVLAAAVAAGIAVLAAGGDGAVLVGVTAGLAVAFGLVLRRALGGVTGDTLGAALELSETVALVIAVALVSTR
jgi:adenosylcobinamide-GDP ribazoletransferase